MCLPEGMSEYLLLIRNRADHQSDWTPEKHHQFLKACERYIGELKKDGHVGLA